MTNATESRALMLDDERPRLLRLPPHEAIAKEPHRAISRLTSERITAPNLRVQGTAIDSVPGCSIALERGLVDHWPRNLPDCESP